MIITQTWREAIKRRLAGPATKIAVITVLLFVVTAVFVPRALSSTALAATFPAVAVLALAAVGETLVIQQRGLDLSVPGNIAMSAYLVAVLPSQDKMGLPEALAVVALFAITVGVLNGILVAKAGITPLVATLAVGGLLQGAVLAVSNATAASVTPGLARFGSGTIAGVSVMLWISAAVTVIVGLFIGNSSVGRRFVGVGASPAAGRAAGLVVNRYVIASYVAGSLCYAGAGILLVSYLGTSSSSMGDTYELAVIAAVIIGGTPLVGGRGSVAATWIAAMLLAELDQVVATLGAPSSTQLLIQSVVIAVAAALGRMRIGQRVRRPKALTGDV